MSTTGGTTGVVKPLTPMTPITILSTQYVTGLNLAYASTTTFTVSIGACKDQSGLNDIVMGTDIYSYANQSTEYVTPLPVAVTVSTATSGAGGLDTGTLAASTLYSVYAIGDSRGFNNASVVFSATAPVAGVNTGGATPTSITLPTGPRLPAGYDMFRYIGSIATDGSSNIRPFTQTGSGLNRTMRYQVPTAPGSAATSGSATYASIGVLGTLTPAKQVDVILGVSMDSHTAGNILYLAPYGNVALASSGFQAKLSSSVTTAPQHDVLVSPQASNSGTYQVMYATTEASDAVTFLVIGYVDTL